MATVQLWLNIAGLVGMAAMLFAGGYSNSDFLRFGVVPFGALYAVGVILFAYNMWRTLSGALPAPVPPRPPQKPSS
jgi:hypothetical protein